jgi:hypothetical protein
MSAPRVCPYCGTESIEPTFLYATLAVSFDGMQCTISGLHAYRCDNTHFFIIFGDQTSVEELDGESRASSVFV